MWKTVQKILYNELLNLQQMQKKPKKKTRGPLGYYRVGNPLDHLGIDILGRLPETKNKNKYLLVIGDYFTRWMEALPLPNQKAEVVAKTLVHEFISKFGVPLEIHTDQGKNFECIIQGGVQAP